MCRPVYCPSGQTYDFHGRCNFPNKLWYNSNHEITINLTSENPVNKTDFQTITKDLLDEKFELNFPWPKQWYIKNIYLLLPTVDDDYLSLHVTITNQLAQVRPRVLIATVKKMIKRKWTLEIVNRTVVFTSGFSPYYLVSNYNESNEHFIDPSKQTFASRYQVIYNFVGFQNVNHPITKLFFCNQIELFLDEFTQSTIEHILFNEINGRFLFWYEFQLFTSISGRRAAKVCIEDSGFEEIIAQSANPSAYLHSSVFDVFIFVQIMFVLNG